jgi:hypothetical protein
MNRLILPSGAERIQQMDNVRAVPENNQPKFNLPQEMKDEVRKYVPEAKEIASQVHALLSKGQAAQVALVCQEPVRVFLGEHVRSLLPQMARTFAHVDRMQVLGFFRQISEQRLSPANLSAERIDRKTYELAMSDFMSLISRVPAQIFPIEVGLPDLDLEEPSSTEGETNQNTTQGESSCSA